MHNYNIGASLNQSGRELETEIKQSQFQSALFGAVSHPTNILKEFLSLLSRGNKVKALILSWMDGWMRSGKEWVYGTCRDLAEQFGYDHKTIHRHLKELVEYGILERRRAKRWPTDQAYTYRVKFERLLELYKLDTLKNLLKPMTQGTLRWLSQNWNIEVTESEYEDIQNWNIEVPKTEQLHNPSLIHLESAQHQDNSESVCEESLEEKSKEVDQESTAIGDVLSGMGFAQLIKEKPLKNSQDSETDKNSAELVAKVNEMIQEPLQPIRWAAVRGTVRKYPENLSGALMAVQQGLADGWMNNPTGYFLKALKEGIKPEAVGAEPVSVMGRNQWWKLVGQQWGEARRNQLILRVSDMGQGMVVCFANGLQVAFDQVRELELEQVYALATQTRT